MITYITNHHIDQQQANTVRADEPVIENCYYYCPWKLTVNAISISCDITASYTATVIKSVTSVDDIHNEKQDLNNLSFDSMTASLSNRIALEYTTSNDHSMLELF